MARRRSRDPIESPAADPVIQNILDMRESGSSRAEIRRQLVAQGYEEQDARRMIDQALGSQKSAMASRDRGGGGGGGGGLGLLGTIGILALVNLLSYVFDWGWFFY